MDTVPLSEIRRALKNVPSGDLPDLLIRLARFKKDNKELLSYLLFASDDEAEFIRSTKEEINSQFKDNSRLSPYMAKKGIRKILLFTNQHIRYSGLKRTEVELLMHFCTKLRKTNLYRNNPSIKNMLKSQVQKVKKAFMSMHEDLQFEYAEEIEKLEKEL